MLVCKGKGSNRALCNFAKKYAYIMKLKKEGGIYDDYSGFINNFSINYHARDASGASIDNGINYTAAGGRAANSRRCKVGTRQETKGEKIMILLIFGGFALGYLVISRVMKD